jgi:D-alanine--poly(phosphoribitol) ligase subunit 2
MTQGAARPYILTLLARKAQLPAHFDDATDFIAAGVIDSIGIIKFVLELESHFGVEIGAEDIESDEFRTLGGLIGMIDRKRVR